MLTFGTCAEHHGVLPAGAGTPFMSPAKAMVSDNRRYENIAGSIEALAFEHHLNGLHIHVGVPEREAALGALNYLPRWLPVLLAMSANSPFWCGEDTAFSSRRVAGSRLHSRIQGLNYWMRPYGIRPGRV